MILNELYEKSPGYQDENEDQSKARIGDLRKTKLTLKQINKLRIMNDVRTYEQTVNAKRVRRQYSTQETPEL
jgi:hypothetical protein